MQVLLEARAVRVNLSLVDLKDLLTSLSNAFKAIKH